VYPVVRLPVEITVVSDAAGDGTEVIEGKPLISITQAEVVELAAAARVDMTPDPKLRTQAAAELSYRLEQYIVSTRLGEETQRQGQTEWTKAIVDTTRNLIRLLCGDPDAVEPFANVRGDEAAAILARGFPGADQRELRTLRALQLLAGVHAEQEQLYQALIATVLCTGNGAAALLLLAKQCEEGSASSSRSNPIEVLFDALKPIFEQLHPGQRFVISNERPANRSKSLPGGPAFRWSQELLGLAATRFGEKIPEFTGLRDWAASHPDGLAMRIRHASSHGHRYESKTVKIPDHG
jgi:hypothetical protein